MRQRLIALLVITPLLLSSQLSASTSVASEQGTPCGIYKNSKNEVIAGVKFPKGDYQIYTYGMPCNKVLGKKGILATFLKQKDKDPLPKPWKYQSDTVGAQGFSASGVGFRVQLITKNPQGSNQSQSPEKTSTTTLGSAPMSAGMKAALDNLAQFPKSKETPQALNYNFGPNADKDMSITIEKNAKVTMAFFVDFYQDSKPYQIFYGSDKDLDWVIAEWRKYGYADAIGAELFEQSVSYVRSRTGPTSVMIGSDNRLPQTPMILLASRSSILNTNFFKLNNNLQISIIHHVVHGIQGRITGGKDLLLGCWGREGAANFYGWVIMDRNFKTIGGSDYASERREQSKPMFPWITPKTNLLEFSESQWLDTLKLLEGGPRFGKNQIYCNLEQETGYLAYSSGALLYERLVGEFGHQKVMDWWYEIRTTSDMKVAFEKVFKVDINDWYKQSAIPYLMKEYRAWR
jgi:hypothetical protein